jgi:hypothetical protein
LVDSACAAPPMPRETPVKSHAAKLPPVRPAVAVDLPLRGPSKFPIIPDQASDQGL